MIAWVRDDVAKVLGFATSASVSLDQGFFDAGMDSLTAVELRGRLSARLGLSLPTTIAFDHATVRALAAHLLREVAPAPPAPAPTLAPPASAEPIAVIGLGCRFPQAAAPAAFWELLSDGVDALREVPAERWDVDAYYDPEPGVPGKTYTRRGGFLDHVDRFDAQFFGVVPAEATSMDPQHRLLLEVAWEALEHAALVPERLATTSTGVFVGIGSNEYAHLDGDRAEASSDVYAVTGNDASFAAGRLSYVLRLQGPAMSVNTACSSSLVAVHLACQSLRTGESDLALAAGVSLMLSPQTTVYLSQLRALAPDGRCKTFDAAADGYARGEECGVVVLKRLRDAQRDGDRVLALIRGSAVNHDGPSGGLTVPNGSAQQRVLEAALASAGVAPADIDYVEAHGTGTALGDPLEVQALARVFCKDRPADRRLAIGSVKTNLGHLEAAAGIAGLIKVVLSLQHGVVPRHLNLQTPSPHLGLAEVPIDIPTRPTPWPAGERPRLAGVSAFGLSGTNAHVVLEEAPRSPVAEGTPPASAAPARVQLLTLSAKTGEGLREMAARLAEHIATHPRIASPTSAVARARSAPISPTGSRSRWSRRQRRGMGSGPSRAGRTPLASSPAAPPATHRPRWPSCSRDRERNTQAWGDSSTRRSRSSAPRSIAAPRGSTGSSTRRSSPCFTGSRAPASTRRGPRSRRSSRWSTRSRSYGARGASSARRSSDTASARWSRPAWLGSSSSRTRSGSSPRAGG